jgi:hypothetical protein
MTTIIRAESAHDFLALVPSLAGYHPERSLVCVAFRGRRTVGVLRHDLPERLRDHPALVEAIVGLLCKMSGVDGVVPIAYTDTAFGRRGMPQRPLLELLVARAGDAGFEVRDAFCVAPDGWALLPAGAARVKVRPLDLIEQSPASAHPGARVASAGVADLLDEAAPDPGLAPAIEHALAEIDGLADPAAAPGRSVGDHDFDRDRDAADAGGAATILDRLGDLLDPVALGEHFAADRDRRPDRSGGLGVDELAWLLHLASIPAIRDALMLQFAFGPVIGEVALDAHANGPGGTVADRTDDPRQPNDREEPRRPLPRDEDVDDLLARLLVGQTSVRPDPDRIERVLGVLGVAVANAPVGYRPGTLCIAAWLAWALGRGSAAGAMLERALSEEPGHRMAGLLLTFIGSGSLPEWAFSEPVARAGQ